MPITVVDWKKYGQSQAGIAKNFTNHKGGYKDSSQKGLIGRPKLKLERNTANFKMELEETHPSTCWN